MISYDLQLLLNTQLLKSREFDAIPFLLVKVHLMKNVKLKESKENFIQTGIFYAYRLLEEHA